MIRMKMVWLKNFIYTVKNVEPQPKLFLRETAAIVHHTLPARL